MTPPNRIQRKRVKGWKMPPNTKSVTRPGPWGNPFRVVAEPRLSDFFEVGTTVAAVGMFESWLLNTDAGLAVRARAKRELRGFNLACYCAPGAPCHGNLLLKIANEPEWQLWFHDRNGTNKRPPYLFTSGSEANVRRIAQNESMLQREAWFIRPDGSMEMVSGR